MDIKEAFSLEVASEIRAMMEDGNLHAVSAEWMRQSLAHKYSYHFEALGRPIIQYPQDMAAIQEIIWSVRPDLIIETGIAHGGSLVLSASMLALLDYCDAAQLGASLVPAASRRKVLGIDIDIRAHNAEAIARHPLRHLIQTIQGSSIAPETVQQVRGVAAGCERTLVILDSNHTHDHVLAELEAYAPLASPGSYCVVFDTVVEDLADATPASRPWGKGNNPKTAVWEYLRLLSTEGRSGADGKPLLLEIDHALEAKLQITVAPDGYLRRVAPD